MATRKLMIGDEKIFAKSGNAVRLIERSGDEWVVERTSGSSAGKQMLCRPSALLDKEDFEDGVRNKK